MLFTSSSYIFEERKLFGQGHHCIGRSFWEQGVVGVLPHVEQDRGGSGRLPGVPVAGRSLLGSGIDHFLAYDTPPLIPAARAIPAERR